MSFLNVDLTKCDESHNLFSVLATLEAHIHIVNAALITAHVALKPVPPVVQEALIKLTLAGVMQKVEQERDRILATKADDGLAEVQAFFARIGFPPIKALDDLIARMKASPAQTTGDNPI